MIQIDWRNGLELEHNVAFIIERQQKYGVYFDQELAHKYINQLEEFKHDRWLKIRPYLTHEVLCKEAKIKSDFEIEFDGRLFKFSGDEGGANFVKPIYRKNGNINGSILSWYEREFESYPIAGTVELEDIVCGPFSRISIEEPTISKRDLIAKQCLKLGWKPTKFTDGGKPRLTDGGQPVETLSRIGDFGEFLSEWYVYNHRQSSIRGYLKHIRKDGRIPSVCNPCGTNTFRAKHSVIANIPRVTSLFGKEMRELFGVPRGRLQVGADLSGIELRCLAHLMGDLAYIDLVVNGDVHTFNQEAIGLNPGGEGRDIAKTFIYALIYGATDKKLGKVIGGTQKDGSKARRALMTRLPRLDKLIKRISKFAERGWVPSLDRRKVYVRRDFQGRVDTRTALNTRLQSDGAILSKRAMVIADEKRIINRWDAHQIIWYHDELQYETDPEIGADVGGMLVESMEEAGRYYNMKLPITGEYKIGHNWGDCH